MSADQPKIPQLPADMVITPIDQFPGTISDIAFGDPAAVGGHVWFAVASWSNEVRVYNAEAYNRVVSVAKFQHPAPVLGMEIVKGRPWVTTLCADRKVRLYDVYSSQCLEVAQVDQNSYPIGISLFSYQGQQLVAVAQSTLRDGIVRVYQLVQGARPMAEFISPNPITAVAAQDYSAMNGRVLVAWATTQASTQITGPIELTPLRQNQTQTRYVSPPPASHPQNTGCVSTVAQSFIYVMDLMTFAPIPNQGGVFSLMSTQKNQITRLRFCDHIQVLAVTCSTGQSCIVNVHCSERAALPPEYSTQSNHSTAGTRLVRPTWPAREVQTPFDQSFSLNAMDLVEVIGNTGRPITYLIAGDAHGFIRIVNINQVVLGSTHGTRRDLAGQTFTAMAVSPDKSFIVAGFGYDWGNGVRAFNNQPATLATLYCTTSWFKK